MITRDEELKWAYLLDPCFELTNTAGKPLTDGYIEVYIAGTRNKYYCASDFAGTLHPFQIPLDSLGSNIVLANPDNAYDVYVYNRFGNLVMSRYNVTPADGGAVISNTERINELEELVVSAVTGLQGQIDDINETLENKKDKQEPYSVTLTPTQTVSAIIQNENGEMEVIYQEIDLPEEVPNVDIVSPASTLNITTHIDEETNTKTFSIDLSDLGHLEYGQYMATEDVITGANMYRIKGNLNTTLDGKIQLHKGNSYHITVRGSYVCTDINNSVNTLDYIEYSTFTPFHVDVDNTITDPQNFEISYDIFKLSNDTNYYIAFAASAGKVSNLTVEIHSLSNVSVITGGSNYEAGWGINIDNDVISVDPSILGDYVTEEDVIAIVSGVTGLIPEDVATHTEVHEATVTAIEYVTGMIPEAQVQSNWDETDDTQPSYIQNKPDLDIYATHDEVNNVSGVLHEEITNNTDTVIETINNVSGLLHEEIIETAQVITGLIPTDYTTHEEVNEAIVTAIDLVTGMIPDAQVQSDWDQSDDTQVDYIKNKPDLDVYATHDEVYESAVTSIQLVTGLIPDVSAFTTHSEVYEAVVTGVQLATSVIPDPLEAGQYVSIVDNTITVTGLQPEGDYATHTEVSDAIVTAIETVTSLIPDAQIQSDWDQDDNTQVDYIKNKPDLDIYVTHDELIEVVSAVTGIGDYGQFYATAVSGAAIMARTKGTIDVTNDGKIKLTKGSSYHVTVRGRYNQTTPNNVYSSISYIEYITNNNININVDKSITESQFFEISYDLYKLNSDTNYYVFFSGLEGTVNDLFIEIHAIGSVGAGVSGGAGAEYDAGWGIQILNNVISVDPSIFNDYVTENELVTAIQSVVTAIPSEQVQSDWAEADTTDPAYIKNKPDNYNVVAGENIGIIVSGSDLIIAASGSDLTDYATDAEVNSAIVTAINYVTGIIPDAQVQSDWTEDDTTEPSYIKHKPEEYDLVAGENIEIDVVNNSIVISSTTGPITGFATEAEVYNAVVTGVQAATGVIPDSEEVQFEELDITQFAQASAIPTIELNGSDQVTGIDGHAIAVGSFAQVQSNWNETDNTQPSYIQNKPDIPTVQLNGDDQVTAINNHEIAGTGGTTYTAGDYIDITNDTISVTGLDNSNIFWCIRGSTTFTEAKAAYDAGKTLMVKDGGVVGTCMYASSTQFGFILPADFTTSSPAFLRISLSSSGWGAWSSKYLNVQADWNTTNSSAESYIKNKPSIPTIQLNGDDQVTAIDGHTLAGGGGGGGGTTYTAGDYISISNDVISVTGVAPATAIPETEEVEFEELDLSNYALASAVVQSDWAVTAINDPSYIQNKPTEKNLVAGANVTITEFGDDVTIETTEIASGLQLAAGTGITLTVSGNYLVIGLA